VTAIPADAVANAGASFPPAHLTKDPNGIWRCANRSAISYPEDGNATCLGVEDTSFWFKHRNRCIIAAMRCFPPGGYLLDIGGGNGYVARGLREAGFDVAMIEPGEAGSLAAHRRGIDPVICGALQDVGFAPRSIPAAGLFDVLEHFEHDADLLSDIRGLLTPDGRLYLTVPAYQSLFSDEDRLAGHFRRYTTGSLTRVLARAGFHIEYRSYFFAPLLLPIFAFRTLPSWMGGERSPNSARMVAEHDHCGTARHLLDPALNWEIRRIAACRRMPFGSSCLAVARKI
jgi:SAM-dependent methyltransferase